MRIAVVNQFAHHVGGIETYLSAALPALARGGHHVLFVAEQGVPGRPAIVDPQDVPTLSVTERGTGPALSALREWRPDALFVNAVESGRLEESLLTLAPAVYFAHTYQGTCISGTKAFSLPALRPCTRTFGPACLALFHARRCGGLSPVTMLRDYRRQGARLERLRRYGALLTFSSHMREEYLRHGFSGDRVVQVPPVYPLDAVSAAEPPRRASAEDRVLRLAFVGRVDPLKGLHLLLEALPDVAQALGRAVRLTVAGEGRDLPRCRGLARVVGHQSAGTVAVDFVGWRSQAEVLALLGAVDVLCMPSVWPEPFGFVGAEAVRRGVPVAAFDVGAVPEWLRDGVTGAIAPAAPPRARGLSQAVVRAVSIPRSPVRVPAAQGRNVALAAHVDALERVLTRVAGPHDARSRDAGVRPSAPGR